MKIKENYLLFLFLSTCGGISVSTQVGVNTTNPQGASHMSSAGDNPHKLMVQISELH